MIHNHDVRADPHCAAVLQGHQQEVCGLKWSLQVLAPPSSLAPPLQTQPLHRFVARPRVPKAARRWSELAAPAPVRGGMGGAAVRRWPAAGSSQGTQLASGGNDNLLHIWEPRQGRPEGRGRFGGAESARFDRAGDGGRRRWGARRLDFII